MVTMTMNLWNEETGYFEPGEAQTYRTVTAALADAQAVVRAIDGARLDLELPVSGGISLDVMVPSAEFGDGRMVERVFSIHENV